MLPPGWVSFFTKPAPTGSETCVNTMGTERVARWRVAIALPGATMTSSSSATKSATYLRMRSGSAVAQRVSNCTFCPAFQPSAACVSPRMTETGDETEFNRVIANYEDGWDQMSCSLRCARCIVVGRGNDDCHLTPD